MFDDRIKNVQKSLRPNKIDSDSIGVDALLVSSSHNIFYLTGLDVFSTIEREAYMLITRRTASLFTDSRYIEGIKHRLPESVVVLDISQFFGKIKSGGARRIGFEQNLTVFEFKRIKRETRAKLALKKPIVETLRAVKDKKEITLLRSATTLTDMAFLYIKKFIKIGVTEAEIAGRIEEFVKKNGATLSFDPIVAFGPNSAIPHHKTSDRKLAVPDQFVLLDFGVKMNGYCSDMTRTFHAKNSSRKAKKIYQTVLDAQNAAVDFINSKSGGKTVKFSEVATIANKTIESQGFPPIPHGLGHGIGIEVHELPVLSPKSKGKLSENNVFTIEPGIYIPGFGGVRIEDDFIFSSGKVEQLTKSAKNLIDSEINRS